MSRLSWVPPSGKTFCASANSSADFLWRISISSAIVARRVCAIFGLLHLARSAPFYPLRESGTRGADRAHSDQMLSVLAALVAGGAATGAAALAYATLVEPFWLQIRRVELGLRCLPRQLDGLTILHLSDMHAHASDPAGQVLIRRAARLPADLVCLTGDYGDIPEHAHLAVAALDGARGRLGTFAVLGNHDRDATPEREPHVFSDDVGFAVGAALEAGGVSVLYNEAVALDVGGA